MARDFGMKGCWALIPVSFPLFSDDTAILPLGSRLGQRVKDSGFSV